MSVADTPMPGEDPGALIQDQPDRKPDPATELDIEANPQPEPDSSLPPEDDDPEIEKTERQPT